VPLPSTGRITPTHGFRALPLPRAAVDLEKS